jgi:hypothetical protein
MAHGRPSLQKVAFRGQLTFFSRPLIRGGYVFYKHFYGVFGFLMQRNGQKRDKKKSTGKDERKKKKNLSTFSAKSF